MSFETGNLLDGEIYCISSPGELVTKHCVRFIWCGTGYRICPRNSNTTCLTLDPDSGRVFMSSERDMKNQIWKTDPHPNAKGLRLSVRDRYLCIHGRRFYTCTKPVPDSVIRLSPYAGWIRFGALMLEDAGVIKISGANVRRAVKNFRKNCRIRLARENTLHFFEKADMVVYQSGGSFPSYSFAEAKMSDTCCEIMAACNAVRMLRGTTSSTGIDFFKMSAEFEISALARSFIKRAVVIGGKKAGIKELERVGTRDGDWGSDPYRIRRFLRAYNIDFTEYRSAGEMDAALKENDKVIVAYRFDTLHQAIHTYSGIMLSDGLHTFNRYSNYSPSVNYLNEKAPPEKRGIYKSVKHSVNVNDPESRFMVGYILHSIKE